MKKIIFSVMLLCSSAIGFAQLLDVTSIQQVKFPEGVTPYVSTMSPNGDYLLVSDQLKPGLQKYDFATGKLSVVTTAQGSGYDVKILDDGNTIIYRETEVDANRLRKTSLKSKNLSTGEVKTIVKATRDLEGVTVGQQAVYAVNNGKLTTKAYNNTSVNKSTPVVSIKYGQLLVTRNGKTKVISPNGQSGQSYLWPSVSPDGTKILYYLSTKGAYVCDIDGKNARFIGVIRAPKWYDNNIVIGMLDSDNGYNITDSKIIAIDSKTLVRQEVTDGKQIAMYPSANKAGNIISFTTPSGEAYIINVKTK